MHGIWQEFSTKFSDSLDALLLANLVPGFKIHINWHGFQRGNISVIPAYLHNVFLLLHVFLNWPCYTIACIALVTLWNHVHLTFHELQLERDHSLAVYDFVACWTTCICDVSLFEATNWCMTWMTGVCRFSLSKFTSKSTWTERTWYIV